MNQAGIAAYNRARYVADPDRFKANGREQRLRQRYGITVEQYDAMLEAQDGVCAICGRPDVGIHYRTQKAMRLAVDHDKNTGEIRGLLCRHCNQGLGQFGHDSERLRQAAHYMEV